MACMRTFKSLSYITLHVHDCILALKVEIMLAGKCKSVLPIIAPIAISATCAPVKVGNGKACYQCGSYSWFAAESPMKQKIADVSDASL